MSATATALRENADHPVAVPTPVAPPPSAPAVPQRAKPKRSTLVLAGLIAAALLGAGIFWLAGRGKESTDDAQVEGRVASVSPRVSGQVARVLVLDNQVVKQGDLLVEIDPKDLDAKLAGARADLETARAALASAEVNLRLTRANSEATLRQAHGGLTQASSAVRATRGALDQERADITSAEAAYRLAQLDWERAQTLRKADAIAQADLDARQARFDQARAAYDAARSAGIKLMVNYWIAWSPETYTAFDRVKAGDAGKIRKIEVRFGHEGPIEIGVSKYFGEWLNDAQRNGGGAIIDFGCYGADLLRWYLGKPASVSAVTHTFKPQTYKVDDDAVIVANYPDAVGIIEASWNWPMSISEVFIYGDKAAVLSERNSVRIRKGRGAASSVELATLPPERKNATAFFVDAVSNNKPVEGILSPEFNLDVIEILEAAKISARTGQVVKLQQPFQGSIIRK